MSLMQMESQPIASICVPSSISISGVCTGLVV